VFSVLRHRNFRLLWIGLMLSFIGSFMQSASLLWHVSLLVPASEKGWALGLVGLVRAVPVMLFSLVAGVTADAFDRRRVMVFTQIGGTIAAGGLALLAFSGVHAVWPVYVLAAVTAAVGAFDPPARHSMVAMLVPREELAAAVNLNSAMVQATSVLGPAAAGLMIAHTNVGWAYAANSLSFLFVVAALLMMRGLPAVDRHTEHARDQFSFAAAREGLRYVFNHTLIRSTMLIDFFATFFASAMALLPIFAQDVLHVGARGYGILAAAPAVGASIATLAMLPLSARITRQGAMLVGAVLTYGVATIVFGLSQTFWLTFTCLALSGSADAVSTIIRNLVRQLETPDAMRGRMIGVNMLFFMGGPQLGELEAGLVAQWAGARLSVITGGIGCLLATSLLAVTSPALWSYRAGRGRSAAR
jgi:MFS family permease